MTGRGLKDMEHGEAAVATRFTWLKKKKKVEGGSYLQLLNTAGGVKKMEPGPSQS